MSESERESERILFRSIVINVILYNNNYNVWIIRIDPGRPASIPCRSPWPVYSRLVQFVFQLCWYVPVAYHLSSFPTF